MENFNIRKNIDFHYNRLVEALISDIYVNTGESSKTVAEIVKYLLEIGQLHKAKLAILNAESKRIEVQFRTSFLISRMRLEDKLKE